MDKEPRWIYETVFILAKNIIKAKKTYSFIGKAKQVFKQRKEVAEDDWILKSGGKCNKSCIVKFPKRPESKVDIVLYTCQSCNKINPGV